MPGSGTALRNPGSAALKGEVAVPDDQLPVLIPDDVDFTPGGDSPLARHESWKKVACPSCEGEAERDALRKENAEVKSREQELRSAAEVAQRFLEAEKAISARLREDLASLRLEREPRRPVAKGAGHARGLRRVLLPLLLLAALGAAFLFFGVKFF